MAAHIFVRQIPVPRHGSAEVLILMAASPINPSDRGFLQGGHGFLVGEDDGQGFRFFDADEVGGQVNVFLENMTIKKKDDA